MRTVIPFSKYDILKRLKQRRIELKLAQKSIAYELGIKIPSYSMKEAGINGITIDELLTICYVLDFPPDELFKGLMMKKPE